MIGTEILNPAAAPWKAEVVHRREFLDALSAFAVYALLAPFDARAQALGIRIPGSLLVRVDRVIE